MSPDGFGTFFTFQVGPFNYDLATIGAKTDGGTQSGRLVLRTKQDGSNSGVLAMHPDGLVSIGVENPSTNSTLYVAGDFTVSGVKNFVQPHPSDPTKEIRYVCLEGNESGTYFRGEGRTVGGRAVIDVPEDFRLVTEAQGLTVQLTPNGALAVMCVDSKDLARIEVRSSVDCDFSYFVNGVRRGFADHQPIQPNSSFVPAVQGVPYGRNLSPRVRATLVSTGILNPDFTPNEGTAQIQGWTLEEANGEEWGQTPQVTPPEPRTLTLPAGVEPPPLPAGWSVEHAPTQESRGAEGGGE